MSDNQVNNKTCATCAYLCLRPESAIVIADKDFERIYTLALDYVRAKPGERPNIEDPQYNKQRMDLLRICRVNCGLGWTTNLTPSEVHTFGCIRHSELTNIVITKKLHHTTLY
jgi:hypothetical protein